MRFKCALNECECCAGSNRICLEIVMMERGSNRIGTMVTMIDMGAACSVICGLSDVMISCLQSVVPVRCGDR